MAGRFAGRRIRADARFVARRDQRSGRTRRHAASRAGSGVL